MQKEKFLSSYFQHIITDKMNKKKETALKVTVNDSRKRIPNIDLIPNAFLQIFVCTQIFQIQVEMQFRSLFFHLFFFFHSIYSIVFTDALFNALLQSYTDFGVDFIYSDFSFLSVSNILILSEQATERKNNKKLN